MYIRFVIKNQSWEFEKKRLRASAIRMEAFSWRDTEEMCHANHGPKPCDKQEALENVTVFAAMLHPMNDCAGLVQANQPHFSAAITLCVCVSLMVKTTLTNSSKWQSPPAKHQQLMETGQAKPGAFAANNQSGAILPTSTPCRGRKPKCSLVAAKHCRLFVAALSSQSEIESWSFVLALNSNRCFKEVHLVGKSCTCHAYLVFWFDIMNPCFNFSDIEDRTCVWILSSGHL